MAHLPDLHQALEGHDYLCQGALASGEPSVVASVEEAIGDVEALHERFALG